ncbi:MAG: 6-bladed beta-propeller [Candidatus Sabulitectum sp.]|nr:6-bladed beta-propeller [Candidatus Sabulitectum sp.]
MKNITMLLFVFVSVVFFACGTPEPQPDQALTVESTEIPHYIIAAVDTIGIELGDSNYVFGQTDAALFGTRGEILVLDGSKKQISVFSPDGEFLRTIGRQGSGPGEFLRPMAMALLGNGQIAVSDPWGGKITLFDSSYAYHDEITGFFPAPPLSIEGADGQAIIGLMKKFDIENDLVGYALARLDGTAEPAYIYAEEMVTMEPTMIGPGYTETTVAFASDIQGRVFTSTTSTDNYLINGFFPDGELFLEIQLPYDAIAKTQQEMDKEIEDFNTSLENRATSGGGGRMQGMGVQIPADELNYEPLPDHYAISELMIDPQERIWARRGSEPLPYFDVFDLEGELLFTAAVEEGDPDSQDWTIVVGENNLLGFSSDPEGYPKVVILILQ